MSIKHFERRYDISLEQALALNAAPLLLEPAVIGFAFQAESYSLIRNGQRFATQPGSLQLRCIGSTVRYVDIGSPDALTLEGPDSQRFAYVGQGSFVGAASDHINHYGSKGVEAFVKNGNPTVDEAHPGSPLIIVVEWRLLPTYAETS